ncbi:hypothetical protein HYE39_03955 [Mycoplasmopsis bovis]|nr:hypothetical protein HYE39_03955 [Mycoplasmopsis bovis]
MFKNSSAPQLNFTLIGVALELTIKQQISLHLSEFCFLVVIVALIKFDSFIKYFFKSSYFLNQFFAELVSWRSFSLCL